LRDLNSVKKIDINSTKLSYSIALASLSTILFSSIFAQLYLLPFNPLSGIGHVNKVYAEGELKLKISVDQDPIQQGDTQKVTVIIRDANSNDKIGDAFIKLAIEPPSGKIGTGTANTDDNGQATFNIHISSDADTGTFNVAARASENGYASKTVTTSFEVVSNGNNNGDNNGNGNSNDDHDGHGHPHGGNNNNNDQVQVISQSNDCGNGKFSSDIKCQNIGNQIQGGGGHKNGGHHGGQSQSAAQANVCGNGKGASDINCQNLSNQIQGDGNAVNVIGVQPDNSVDTNQYPSLNDQSNAEFARAVHSYSNNGDEFGTSNSANSNPFSDACNQAINRHVAVGGLHGEMASQMRGQICG